MFLPLQITLRNIPRSEDLEQLIRERAERLHQFHRLTGCRVVVERVGREGPQFAVRVALGMAGSEIAVDRRHNADVRVALQDAFDAARRQLEDEVRLQRGDDRASPAADAAQA